MHLSKFIQRYRIDEPRTFRIADHDPGDTGDLDIGKKEAKDFLAEGIERLADLQERLYAQGQWSVLAIFQAMDAAGKDSAIKHVMSGINPQGCEVHAFKAPSDEELRHDFLWRTTRRLPERGRIGIFNRSYYEEVLVVRVHANLLVRQNLPLPLVTENIWRERFEDIGAFERHLARSGTVILKFFLNVSREEQKRRFLERIDTPAKNWKFSHGDVADRRLWSDYMTAYEDMIRHTSAPDAAWYVVPADNKWFTRLVVAGALVETLERLGPEFPVVDEAGLRELKRARDVLLNEEKE